MKKKEKTGAVAERLSLSLSLCSLEKKRKNHFHFHFLELLPPKDLSFLLQECLV